MEFLIVTRRDCGLCEDMEAVVERFAGDRGFACETLDVDSDPALANRYGDEVPVLLVNGRKAFKYRVTESELRKRVRAERRRELARRWRALLRGGSDG